VNIHIPCIYEVFFLPHEQLLLMGNFCGMNLLLYRTNRHSSRGSSTTIYRLSHGKRAFLNGCCGAERPFPVTHPVDSNRLQKKIELLIQ
jgi:hypothetical protein